MDTIARARQLRQRAHRLRRFAEAIEASPVMHLDQHGNIDTWRGARPDLCRATLATNQHQLHAAAEDLRWHAYRFEQQAEELDAVARSHVGLAG
jgi:DICT domain-containing protein